MLVWDAELTGHCQRRDGVAGLVPAGQAHRIRGPAAVRPPNRERTAAARSGLKALQPPGRVPGPAVPDSATVEAQAGEVRLVLVRDDHAVRRHPVDKSLERLLHGL